MNPHSRLSQFDARPPKQGPMMPARPMDVSLAHTVSAAFSNGKQAQQSSSPSRPMITNPRVKQTEKYRNEMYLSFVTTALQEKANGRTDRFDELVNQFNAKNAFSTPPAQLRSFIQMLSHVVSRLERTHAALVEALVRMPWAILDSTIVKSYTGLIGMLLSARPEYLSLVLGMIAQGFTFQSSIERPDNLTSSTTRRLVYDRLHYLLRHLITLVPTLPSTLMPLLSRNFPHKRQNVAAQSTYIRNLLRISGYCPELSDKVLSTIIDRAIQIDVEIQVELEELEAETEDVDEMFEIDPFDTLIGQEEEDSDSDSDDFEGDSFSDISSDVDLDDSGHPEAVFTNVRHIQAMVKKLDTILYLTFEHFDQIAPTPSPVSSPMPDLPPLPPLADSFTPLGFATPTPSPPPIPRPEQQTPPPPPISNPQTVRSTFHALLGFFDRTILLTFKSRYTQFLIFWYTSLDPDFSDIFQGMLIERALLDPSTSAVTRAAAASYIGSFVSRARFVERDGARRVVSVLCDWLSVHLDGDQDTDVFYAISQSLFLIFCFRWRDLQDEGKWMPALSIIYAVVNSPLAPLRVCSQGVAVQFARVAHVTDFLYCYPALKGSSSGVSSSDLNTFFPFDPYRLPKSGHFIQGIYREWAEVAVDEDEDESDEEENDDVGLPMPITKTEDDDELATGLGASLGAMSISPLRTIAV